MLPNKNSTVSLNNGKFISSKHSSHQQLAEKLRFNKVEGRYSTKEKRLEQKFKL